MWEAISTVLTSHQFVYFAGTVLVIVLVGLVAVKLNLLDVNTKHVRLGMSDSDRERAVLREQLDWVDVYLQGLEGKVRAMTPEMKFGGFFTKHILDLVYKEIVKWITFNHISADEAYIRTKQQKLISLVYAQEVKSEFLTTEFKARMERWVEEIIKQLVEIRRLYSR